MKLYYSPGACSLAPHIVLRETGLPFELVRVDLASHKLAQPDDYYSVNAKGSVPVLELDDGERLTEGPIIAQWICDRAERTDLMPAAGTMARYRVMEWQNYVTSELHKSYSPLFKRDFHEEGKAWFRRALRQRYEYVDARLQENEFLTGSSFTAADAYLFVVTNWAAHTGVDLQNLGALDSFMSRVRAREAVQQALVAEGLVKTA
ncbi:MAG: glutathione transferase GstA [Xanthomonadaceae bacterium]|nr:glutathione transferase GstA [Xanthomonadaceae bacterium]